MKVTNAILYPEAGKVELQTEKGRLLVQKMTDRILRCLYTEKEDFHPGSPLGIKDFVPSDLRLTEEEDAWLVAAEQISLRIDKATGAFCWMDGAGKLLVQEKEKELTQKPLLVYSTGGQEPILRRVKTVDGDRNFVENLKAAEDHMVYRARLFFQWQEGEQIHGLGQGEEGIWDYRGHVQYLYQHNMRIPFPCFLSDQGYGLLADCGSLMTFNDDERGSYLYLDTVEQLDYYMIAGNADQIVQGFRQLTGKAVMLPKWAYGYVQSREAYKNQEEMVETAERYRSLGIGLDCLVQDWHTWEEDAWGNKHMDPQRYPDLKAMNQKLHDMHVHSMVSIWPNMNSGTKDCDEMAQAGYLLYDYSTYDAFREEARALYWKQAEEDLFSGGFDSWWCDSTEPFSGPDWNGPHMREPWERFQLVGQEHKKFLGEDRANLFALKHAQGIFENQRKAAPDKRVLNLTRSGYVGIQQYGTILWSGDISATWEVLRRQVVEGLNMSASGMPYWTLDIGAFFVLKENWRKRGCFCSNDPNMKWFWAGDYEEGLEDMAYRELYVRWLEYGVFLPMFRSHGTDVPREIWNFGEPGQPYYEAIRQNIQLRYRLLPYIYSLAGSVWLEDQTMLRSLLFDFPEDPQAVACGDQYLFGHNLLICPVTEPMDYDRGNQPLHRDHKWDCYLPAGCTWYDFYSGACYEGGQTVAADAPLDHIPVFVKAGSILPMEAPGMQYTQQPMDTPLELHIYPGADGDFTYYEDAGDGYQYEEGDYNAISMTWKEADQTLSIGGADKIFPQGIIGRTCRAILGDCQVEFRYEGKPLQIKLP